MPKVTKPYTNLNPVINNLLSNQSFAETTINAWLYSKGMRKLSDLSKYEFEEKVRYVEDSKLEFVQVGALGRFVSMRNIKLWTNQESKTLYAHLSKARGFLESKGMIYAEGSYNSFRRYAAGRLGLEKYVQQTNHITLFTPCCVVWFLLTGRTSECESFRKFFSDWGYQKPYNATKLILTVKEGLNVKN